jgi:hypothetical protein
MSNQFVWNKTFSMEMLLYLALRKSKNQNKCTLNRNVTNLRMKKIRCSFYLTQLLFFYSLYADRQAIQLVGVSYSTYVKKQAAFFFR